MIKSQEPESGVLYLVGTPIGHMGDLSPRARSLLKNVSAIACEDTRHSGQLLRIVGSKASLYSFHKHNTKSRIPKFLTLLDSGMSLALITDAGLPGISDPGEELVIAAKESGHDVICIPGPCAATTALVISGLPSQRFCFEGFLPTKSKERKLRLEQLAIEERTIILYESPHRLVQLLEELVEFFGVDRPLQVSRELTKRYEEQIGPNVSSALKHFLLHSPQGEFTLVIGGYRASKTPTSNDSELLVEMELLISKGFSANEAAKQLAQRTGHAKRFLYSLLHRKIPLNDNEA